jgi:hypothetical protein
VRLIDWTQQKSSEYSVLLTLTGITALCTWPFVFHWLWAGKEPAALSQAEAASAPSFKDAPQAASEAEDQDGEEETGRFPGDPALSVLRKIRSGSFSQREEVATGRFLARFDHLAPLLACVDEMGLLPLRRGVTWTHLEAPLVPRRPQDGSGRKAELRMVKTEGAWKLEHLEAFPEDLEK